MSTVFLHVGQCGNQLGQAFWEEASTSKWSCGYQIAIHSDNRGPSSKVPIRSAMPASVKIPQVAATTKLSTSPKKIPFALVDGSLPCVLIDAEPKVIRRCLDKKRGSAVLTERVRKECCVCDRTGRGNNWAYGYHGTRVLGGQRDGGCGQDLLGRVRDLVRKVVERCNRFSGFIVLHSIAGGTGSGDCCIRNILNLEVTSNPTYPNRGGSHRHKGPLYEMFGYMKQCIFNGKQS